MLWLHYQSILTSHWNADTTLTLGEGGPPSSALRASNVLTWFLYHVIGPAPAGASVGSTSRCPTSPTPPLRAPLAWWLSSPASVQQGAATGGGAKRTLSAAMLGWKLPLAEVGLPGPLPSPASRTGPPNSLSSVGLRWWCELVGMCWPGDACALAGGRATLGMA